MARSVAEIKKEMTDSFISDVSVIATYNLEDGKTFEQQFSVVSIESIIFYSVAFCIWGLENLWDGFQSTINALFATQTAHTLKWYRTKALAFQFGFNLIADTDQFDNTGYTDGQVQASKVVKYAAVNETTIDNKRVLLIKIATISGGELTQLTSLQETAFTTYIQEIKDAGNAIIIYNRLADILRGEVDFYYDPLLLDGNGNRLDGLGTNPVEAAANNYLLNLPFNGEFSNAGFVDALQAAYGASERNVFLKSMERKTGTAAYVNVNNTFIPDAGYVRFETDGLTINYIPHVSN